MFINGDFHLVSSTSFKSCCTPNWGKPSGVADMTYTKLHEISRILSSQAHQFMLTIFCLTYFTKGIIREVQNAMKIKQQRIFQLWELVKMYDLMHKVFYNFLSVVLNFLYRVCKEFHFMSFIVSHKNCLKSRKKRLLIVINIF